MMKRFEDVTLKDCIKPAVGNVEVKRIDPALWFKVLVLDAVFVDCDTRGIHWNRTTQQPHLHCIHTSQLTPIDAVQFFADKEIVFEDGECYDFDPYIDELFDMAADIVRSCAGEPADSVPLVAGRLLLQLLHMFILPAIKFHVHDRPAIAQVLTHIEQQKEAIEHSIQQKNKTKQNTENSLRRQREKLLATGKFVCEQSSQYIARCDDEFLAFFLEHVEKDIKRTNEHLIDLERGVQSHKALVDATTGGDGVLQKLRSDRNSAYELIETCITTREAIKNVISRPHVKKNIKRTPTALNEPFHELYTEITRTLSRANKEIQELINNKIHISSVRESICLALQEINTDGESYGYHRKVGTYEMDANIYDCKNRPEEWSTLTDKVSSLLRPKQLGFVMRKKRFCEMITAKIQRIFDDSKMFAISGQSDSMLNEPLSSNTAAVLQIFDEDCQHHRPTSQKLPTKPPLSTQVPVSYSSRWSIGTVSRSEVEAICREIVEHISQVSRDMALELQPGTHVNAAYMNSVYVCYEYHVSECLMPLLSELFERSYRDQCKGLANWLCHVSLSDLGFDDIKIAALLGIGQHKGQSGEIHKDVNVVDRMDETDVKVPLSGFQKDTSIATRPRHTLGSMQLKQLTLDTLYSSADEECCSLEDSFEAALEIDYCVAGVAPDRAPVSEACHLSESFGSLPGASRGQQGWPTLSNGITGCERSNGLCRNNASTIVTVDSNNVCTEPSVEQVTCSATRSNLSSASTCIHTQSSSSNDTYDMFAALDDICLPPAYHDVVRMRGECTVPPPTSDSVCMRHIHMYADAPPTYSTLSPVHAKFHQTFHRADSFLMKENQSCTLFKKYKQITKLLRYMKTELSGVREAGGCDGEVCADDLLDVSTMIIVQLDAEAILKLYSHMNLMIQLSPPFMQGNAHEYALVTLNVAYHYLFEQQVLHRSRRDVS